MSSPRMSPEMVQALRDYLCPYCKLSTLEGKGAGRGRIPRRTQKAAPHRP